MSAKDTKDLHKDMEVSSEPDNIIVRILKAKIDYVDAGWAKFNFVFKERIVEDGELCDHCATPNKCNP